VPQPDTSASADYFSKTGFVAEQCHAAQILFLLPRTFPFALFEMGGVEVKI